MHHYQRTVLNSITLLILAVSFALLIFYMYVNNATLYQI